MANRKFFLSTGTVGATAFVRYSVFSEPSRSAVQIINVEPASATTASREVAASSIVGCYLRGTAVAANHKFERYGISCDSEVNTMGFGVEREAVATDRSDSEFQAYAVDRALKRIASA